ncbi:MAG TPA: O-antigen ligase family protein [Aquabacterium sp.]|nr:O-antigen ligase family protein [Aquabacterium sp.]
MTSSNRVDLSLNSLWAALACINVLALLLPLMNSDWEYASTITPWLWILCLPSVRQRAIQVAKTHRELVLASALASLWIAMGSVARQVPDEWRTATTPLLWLPIAAIFSSDEKESRARSLLPSILALAILSSVLFLGYQFFVERSPRPPGFSFNVLTGPMLLMMSCLFAVTYQSQRHPSQTAAFIVIGLATIGGAIMTQARTALMCFVIACCIYAIFLPQISKRILITGAVIAIIWAALISSRFDIIKKDIDKYQGGSHRSSLGERTDAIVWGLQHFFDKPWLGFGREPLRTAFNQRWMEWHRPEESISKIVHLHNDYLQLALSYGIPTLIFTLAFWFGLARSIRRSNASDFQRAGCQTVLFMIATTSMVDSFTHWQGLWSMCVTCAGLTLIVCRNPNADGNKCPNTK